MFGELALLGAPYPLPHPLTGADAAPPPQAPSGAVNSYTEQLTGSELLPDSAFLSKFPLPYSVESSFFIWKPVLGLQDRCYLDQSGQARRVAVTASPESESLFLAHSDISSVSGLREGRVWLAIVARGWAGAGTMWAPRITAQLVGNTADCPLPLRTYTEK